MEEVTTFTLPATLEIQLGLGPKEILAVVGVAVTSQIATLVVFGSLSVAAKRWIARNQKEES